ncbi:MAG: NAD(P)-binding protein [Alphaproteobacteria bacterium]|nr:NAD(P)-binding protein [Alphaproteobacteria bacterium]
MKIAVIGGGPAGLYFAYLMKRDNPGHEIRVIEQNPRDATFGFGVVFSDRALEFLRADDEATYQYLTPHMQSWADLKIVHKDEHMAIDGNGFAAIGRLEFLNLLQDRCESVGVELEFETVVESAEALGDADLIVAADGVNSPVRRAHAQAFQASETRLDNPFVWFGTTQLFDTLSLTFRENGDGVFCAHHYRYSETMSTFIVETDADTFENAGFANMSDAESRAYCEAVFAADLAGHPLISNKSEWRWFPQIWNERWSAGNIVLLGDALHTAHFSIGSGTRLAMEDAIALFQAMSDNDGDLVGALARYEEIRRPRLEKLVDAAVASAHWYEQMAALMRTLEPYEFARSYMTRTGRVSDERLQKIAPKFMERYAQHRTS